MSERVNTGTHLMSGNEAVAEGALSSGLGGYFGYPITPSTSIMEHIVKRIRKLNDRVAFMQAEDELAAITAVIGSSWTRTKSMTATSGPGFSLMQEGIGLAVFTETPLVLVNVMRGGPSTGLPTFPAQQEIMQTHFGSHGDYIIPTVVPDSVQECYDLTIEAFNISEALRTPAFVLSDQIMSSLKERVIIPESKDLNIINRSSPENPVITYKGTKIDPELVPPMNCFGEVKRGFSTGLSHNEKGMVDLTADTYEKLLDRQHEKILRYQHLFPQPKLYNTEDADLIIVSMGSSARASKRAIIYAKNEGFKVGLFNIKTLWPFPKDKLREITKDKKVLVVEMSRGQLVWPVEKYLLRDVHTFSIYRGQVPQPTQILSKIREVLQQ